ncbi:MAG: GAF domain-containing protein [Actinobacteria bacterium]|nr:MAG: GAF domain-containing protein [Actinomycetota bacterium]TMM22768.1 MAG: GAF domain-containing protein [Actinomycetota bacterium]
MSIEPGRTTGTAQDATALKSLTAALRRLAEGSSLEEALGAIADAAAAATAAEVAVVRVLDETGRSLEARAVSASSTSVAAELQGSRMATSADGDALRSTGHRLGLGVALGLPIALRDRELGRLELFRRAEPFTAAEESLGRLAAEHAAVALASLGGNGKSAPPLPARDLLRLGGDALATGLDEQRTAEEIARLAAQASGAVGAVVWRFADDLQPYVAGSFGAEGQDGRDVVEAIAARAAFTVTSGSWVLLLGQPPSGALQLRFEQPLVPSDEVLDALTTFAARAAHALRSSERAQRQSVELERSRALVAVVGQAIAQLSLAHTLETAIERIAELLGAERLAVYLLEPDEGRLLEAAGRGLAGPHTRVAERLIDLARGPRGHEAMLIDDARSDFRLASVREQLTETGIEAAVGLPLRVREDLIGLLAVYPPSGRTLTPDELALVTALAAQLAVAVQNARLHEQVKRREAERREALEAEQQASRTLRSLYEISRTFAQSLSLETTLEALVRTFAELLVLDAVGIRMPDERGEALVTQALHVRDERMTEAVKTILLRPQPLSPRLRSLFAGGRPFMLDPGIAHELGGAYGLLVPFLERGSTTAIVPVSTPAEVLGTLTLLSLDPGRPLGQADLELALSVAGQAALALENARLYQQQKRFSDTMQRSLLPRVYPKIEGLELGDVYESSARLDVGGDVYDFLRLDDGRLAVTLGDVTGHGIDAAADMAMAKFVFRSLAREHPEPGDFLAAANEVVVGEVALSKFITMLYLTVDPATGAVACGCAGHPWPRLVTPAGDVTALEAGGLALGVDAGQSYNELREQLPVGGALVLYTDGVIEARRSGEPYGDERLDALIAAHAGLPAAELARALVDDCRAFTGGDLTDDCAVVVIRRT